MSSSDTRPSIIEYDPLEVGLTTPALRDELEDLAPELIDKFDSFSRGKTDQIEEYGRRYNEAKADLARTQATTLSGERSRPHREACYPGSHFSDDPSATIDDSSSITDTNTSTSSKAFGQPQAAVRAKDRVPLTDSTTSPKGFGEPQAAVRAKHRAPLTESTSSSKGSNQLQAAVRAKQRVPLTDSTRSNDAYSEKASHPPQAVVKAKHRIPLTDSTRSNGTDHRKRGSNPRHHISASEALLTMGIQIRLLPVVQLLTASDLTPGTRKRARDLAQAALHYANECNAGHPLAARCSFYIALACYDPDNKATTQDAVTWFQRALEASEYGYPEGQWAQEWLNRYQSINIAANSRPSTASSWFSGKVNGVWNFVMGSRNNTASSADSSKSARKPRPNILWRIYSGENARDIPQQPAGGERIPSYTTENTNSTSPTSQDSMSTQDHHGLKWSPKSPWGKGEILPGRGRFELVQSPEPINEEDEDEEEQHIPANVLGGLVEAGALSPAMQRSPAYYPRNPRRQRRVSNFNIPLSDFINPPGDQVREWRIANLASEPSGSTSPGTGTGALPDDQKPSPTKSSYFASAPATKTHTRAQSLAAYPTSPLSSPPDYAQSERASSPTPSSNSGIPSRKKKRNSLSLIIRATGLDVHRGKRDEASQMEEGESPAFKPRTEEEGLYRRRSNDVVQEDV